MPSPFTIPLATTDAAQVAAAIATQSLYGLQKILVAQADEMGIFPSIPKGDLALVSGQLLWTDGIDQAGQEITSRLGFFLGECFIDTRQGLPYYRDIFVKAPNQQTVSSVFQRTILSVPGVIALPEFTYSFDRPARVLGIQYVATWLNGQPIPARLDFILGDS